MEQEHKPKWILELENRKRKPRLAHETGAGAPCLTCESACPGLDLHFWRKICKNCKCRGDDHDFDDEEFPQFELLFGPNVKNKKKRSIFLQVNDKKQVQNETPFEWIPPDTTKELAADYMKALPSEKLPIKGSPGAALRRQQLQKQLPLHDIDHKVCDALSEQEKNEFEKYLQNLKNCAGQGKVSKWNYIRPFDRSVMTPANASDIEKIGPQYTQQLNNYNGLNLRTPSSFIPKVSQTLAKSNFINLPNVNEPVTSDKHVIHTQHSQAVSEVNPVLGQYHPALTKVSNSGRLAEIQNVPTASKHLEGHQLTKLSNQSSHVSNDNSMPCKLNSFKIPSSIANEEYVQTGKVDNISEPLLHKVKSNTEKIVDNPMELNLKMTSHSPSNVLQTNQILPEVPLSSAINVSDVPCSYLDKKKPMYAEEELKRKCSYKNANQISMVPSELEYMSCHPQILTSEEIRRNSEKTEELKSKLSHSNKTTNDQSNTLLHSQLPYGTHSQGVQAKINALLPVQSNIIHSEILNNPVLPETEVNAAVVLQNPENINQLQQVMEGMTINLPKAHQCHKCEEDICCGDVVVTAEKIKDAVWHPGCFMCCTCNELLVDLVYFTYKGKLYCARDLAVLLEIPRCFACDELIFVREYTVAEGHNYHVKHFCCWDCDIPLAGQQYISENDRPLCLPCYQNNYAKTCNACNNVIAADQQGVAIKNLNFHAINDCFCCVMCRKGLLNGQIAIKENKLLCSKECIAEFLHRKALIR